MKRKNLLYALLTTVLTMIAFQPAAAQSKYIGLKYESGQLPAGLESIGGRVVADTDEGLMDSLYAVHDLKPAGSESYNPTMVWFEKTIEELEPDRSRVILEVLDVLELPEITEKQTFVPGGCSVNNKTDSRVFALAIDEDAEFFSSLIKVWRANIASGKIEEISAKGVKCENMSSGV